MAHGVEMFLTERHVSGRVVAICKNE